MGLGLSIDKLLEMLRADRHRSKEQTASYLDAVSSQAIALAAIWRGILTNAQLVEMEEPDAFIVGLRRLRERDMRKSYPQLFIPNAQPFGALSRFYSEVTLAVGARIDKLSQEELMAYLANAILDRERAFTSRDEFIQATVGQGTEAEEARKALDNLTVAVDSLDEDAAALATLTLRWRASM